MSNTEIDLRMRRKLVSMLNDNERKMAAEFRKIMDPAEFNTWLEDYLEANKYFIGTELSAPPKPVFCIVSRQENEGFPWGGLFLACCLIAAFVVLVVNA